MQKLGKCVGGDQKQMTIMDNNNQELCLPLSNDEALVFFDWLCRFNNGKAAFEDQAEERVLFDIESKLEKLLPAVLDENYLVALKEARVRVRD